MFDDVDLGFELGLPQPFQIRLSSRRHIRRIMLADKRTDTVPALDIAVFGQVCQRPADGDARNPELVAERILRFANLVGRERVIASTDCGLGGRVHPQIAWAKLEALVSGAALATRQLWG